MRKKYVEERNGRSEENMSFLQKLLTNRTRTFGHHESSMAEYKIPSGRCWNQGRAKSS